MMRLLAAVALYLGLTVAALAGGSPAPGIPPPASPATNNVLTWNGSQWIAGGAIASGTIGSGTLNQMPYYAGAGTVLTGVTIGGDCTFATGSLTCMTSSGVPIATTTGTQTLSGKTLTSPTINAGALSGTFSGTPTYSGVPIYSGLSSGTIVSGGFMGLDSGNHVVLGSGGSGGGLTVGTTTITSGTNGRIEYNNSGVLGELATGTAASQVVLGGVITAGGPTGSATVAPIITYNAAGQVTAVSSATITPAVGSITGFGTGVAAALADNVGSAGAPVVFNGAGGTPSSLTLTNGTGLPAASVLAGTLPSPMLTATPTLSPCDNSTKIATTIYVQSCPAAFVDTTKSASYTINASETDMGNGLTLAATTGTPALTLPAVSSTVFQPGMTLTISVPAISSAVNWTLTNSTGLTLRGLNSTTLVPGTQGTFVANADAATIDFFPGMQAPTATGIGAVKSDASTITISGAGVISCTTATASQLGCAEPDNSTITIVGGKWVASTGGAGCTVSGSAGAVYNNGSNACLTNTDQTFATGTLSLGINTSELGAVKMFGSTSGSVTIEPPAIAGTSTVLTTPAATDTLVGRATTDTLTNKSIAATEINSGTLPNAQAAIPTTAIGTSVTFSAPSGMEVCSSTCTITVPVPAAGYQFCAWNGNNVSTVITFAAIGSSAFYQNTARTAYGTAGTGTLTSGGATGDLMCIVGVDATHYQSVSFSGTWTAS